MKFKQHLEALLQASGWSQEELARHLNVSFAALNAWLNGRAVPRRRAQEAIELLYIEVVGAETIDKVELVATKAVALNYTTTVRNIVEDIKLSDSLTLYLTYHTNTIEGSTMTLADTGAVLFERKTLTNRTQVEQLEAQNHRAALVWLLEQLCTPRFVISDELIRGLHLRLMNGIMENAGQYRDHGVRIMGTHVAVANYMRIPALIQAFCDRSKLSQEDIVMSLAVSHADFEKIHPFSDGNGRIGRLLLLAQALQNGLVPPLVLKERRAAYYKYLELAQMQGSSEPLELFIAQSIITTQKLLFEN